MQYLVSAAEMKAYDSNTIEEIGIPSLVLMERAAYAVAEEIEKRFPGKRSVLIAAGTGNNGGDGLAAGRILLEKGYEVSFVLVGDREKCGEQTRLQCFVLEKCGRRIAGNFTEKEYDIIVDALFGVGLTRELTGACLDGVAWINASRAYKVSVDIPSGIHADTGRVMGAAVQADLTVTFAFCKLGHVLYPGASFTKELVKKEIGITEQSFQGGRPGCFCLGREELAMLPHRREDGNKGSFGKVLVIAGSRNMSGACVLCAGSVYRMGAGMVRVFTAEENREIIQAGLPEAVLSTYESGNFQEDLLRQAMKWASCIVIGPGLGKGSDAVRITRFVLEQGETPLVVDADALNILSEHMEWLDIMKRKKQTVFTPHLGELSRLMGTEIRQCRENLLTYPAQFAQKHGIQMVCKDARSVICSCLGERCINCSGNSGMATAGSGDVLSGIIGGLLAQGMEAFQAACLGAYIHGLAGDLAAEKLTPYCVMAQDLIRELPGVLMEGYRRKEEKR